MKKIICIFIVVVSTQICIAQRFSFNYGQTTQKSYFSIIPYENVRGIIIVSAIINNKEYRFILDTGSPNAITKTLYNELNPNIITKMSINDQSGKSDSMLIVSIDSFTIGGITFQDIPTLVFEGQFFEECFHLDGIIGSNMLRNSIIQFSSINKTITLTDIAKKLTLNNPQYLTLYLDNQSGPWIKVKLNGKKVLKRLIPNFDKRYDFGAVLID